MFVCGRVEFVATVGSWLDRWPIDVRLSALWNFGLDNMCLSSKSGRPSGRNSICSVDFLLESSASGLLTLLLVGTLGNIIVI